MYPLYMLYMYTYTLEHEFWVSLELSLCTIANPKDGGPIEQKINRTKIQLFKTLFPPSYFFYM